MVYIYFNFSLQKQKLLMTMTRSRDQRILILVWQLVSFQLLQLQGDLGIFKGLGKLPALLAAAALRNSVLLVLVSLLFGGFGGTGGEGQKCKVEK